MRWTVTTVGASCDGDERRHHDDVRSAWDDYSERIFGLEMAGYAQDGEEAAAYGKRWSRDYVRDGERTRVLIERAGEEQGT